MNFNTLQSRGALLLTLLALSTLFSCARRDYRDEGYSSKTLQVEQINQHVYRHISNLVIPGYGTFPCNGLVYMKDGAAVVVDTPIDSTVSEELIVWIESRDVEIVAVIPTHFHVDCLGGLGAFHRHGIPSFANASTVERAGAMGEYPVPQNSFDGRFEDVEGLSVIVEHPGPGHTFDNVVAYLPEERVLFGGCLIKEVGAGRGNLADADTLAWAGTVRRVRDRYPKARIIVPGHGEYGGVELLDYTIRMFDNLSAE